MLPLMTADPAAEPFLTVHADARDPAALAIEREIIEAAGGRFEPTASTSEGELIENLQDAEAILVTSARITRRVVEAMTRCKLIIRYGVGLDTLDIPAATDHGMVVAHYPDFCQPEVANHATMLLLACAKKLVVLDRTVRDGSWRPGPLSPMHQVHGETLGLVALGNIGQEFAPRAQALGLNVIAFDPFASDEPFERLGIERVATLDELLGRSDFVSLHTPLTPETEHMMSTEQFRAMKSTAFLINTSRGPTVDQEALIAALDAGEIAGAGLDVFEQEPLAGDSPLTEMENVVLTPHSASFSDYAFDTMKQRVGNTVVALMNGRWPDDVATIANPGVTPRAELPPRN
jgi:D-3-phosphoglycerate dehydrogenase